jgi:hypothetical protein
MSMDTDTRMTIHPEISSSALRRMRGNKGEAGEGAEEEEEREQVVDPFHHLLPAEWADYDGD